MSLLLKPLVSMITVMYINPPSVISTKIFVFRFSKNIAIINEAKTYFNNCFVKG